MGTLDPVELILSLANTPSAGPDADLLRAREEAAAWLRAAALLPAGKGLMSSEHAALLRLRDAVRDVLAAHADGREDDAAAARLTRALADGRLVLTVDPAGTVGLASAARASYSDAVANVAVAIAAAAASGAWRRLKTCPAAGCGLAFHDDGTGAAAGRCAVHAAAGG